MKRLAVVLAACASAMASSPRAWEMNNYRDFLAGRFDGIALAREGRLTLAPRAETLFASDQPIIWSAVRAADGTIYAGTGHRGRVFKIDGQGKGTLLWTGPEPEVFALALGSRDVLYAATSPNGKIYRIENGKASEYYSPGTTYIWSLALGPDGALYAATGDQGKIYRVTGAGQGEVWYETGQSHVTCLAFDRQGRLLAGSEPNGIIYRIAAKGKGFVLYDANLPEIRTLVPASDGSIYAVALGGSLSRRQLGGVQSSQGVPSTASVTVTAGSVTVEAAQPQPQPAQGGVQIKADSAKPQTSTPVAAAAPTAAIEIPGIEKSAVYRIAADNTVESLWSSKEENAYDLLVKGQDLVIATDEHGRIYRVDPDRKVTLLAQTNEGEATRLLGADKGILAATGDMGKIVRLMEQSGTAGTYESPVHDATTVARWGRLSWRGDFPAGTAVSFRTRSGNSSRPDQTWSDWSDPLTDSKGSPIASPNARYVQWRAEFTGKGGQAPAVDDVEVAYLPQNTPPVVRSITAVAQAATGAAAKTAAATASQTSAYTVTVTDAGEAASTTSSGTPTQAVTQAGDNLQITWQAEDPDGDRLVYSLYFRGEDEREWKLLRDRLSENTWTIDADSLADGRYLFRVVASDAPANAPGVAREAELVSSPTLIDHTPPVVQAGAPKRIGSRVEISWTAVDAASAIRRAEYAIDGGAWVPVEPVDKVLDSHQEQFQIAIEKLAPGEHLLVFRAVDAAGNAGLAKVVLR